ncbi:UDP-4-amino-4,6-dideoxy-N-acetyl-beta-L-altrosamine transaminase [Campylobacter hyointestinalis]|uniref:UDP-4-amino-4, 6-dideoxy-N-acetyl-beta-L-altrosamine transaminase n=1 Tax=Campylobacter hyointestinalis TaxID=198 RepID=UPI000CE43E27|nr:UDP-4-amino-4,6-dideoxy-N-acetyl-beta-L-altrosamine transaminase [Campylobacter hyointestinalis]PPB74307.1 UDP-4-amino-4,6-dideoxy-N-acetyl-beta-L-altrosamine transaminase [Campylobacter hyointestinalis subsp. hyointestinalis]PPB75225.1 UDP-4-amino-4,6-dideoxy-N-acetyl-beta-L-altrosamine transaminase [Campylobacter hyointestinalis subsp. hyointestinalis]PPB77548.1 UDP-4-amino-4,6-dideoxy-N-acetyl-beta-L-altrosamine transaminase [Campylobacter hyointestinalis subsp. hyointestinalis]PPB78643.1
MTYSRQSIDDDDIRAVVEVLKSDIITCGKKVDEFEKALCDYTGAKFAVAMNSATSALHAGYLALGLESGDEVITTPITFAATANAALMCGGVVKFADILPNGNIDPKSVEKLITTKTKVITPVDFGGLPVDMETLNLIAKKYNLKVLDDASHALGSSINSRKIGTFGDASIFSFHAVKPITTFEGGALLTNDEETATKARLLRSHGIIKKTAWNSDMTTLGYNYRLSDVACALGISQLKKLDIFIAKRDAIAKFYDEAFEKSPYLSTIKIPTNITSSHHLYPVLLFRDFWCDKESIYEELRGEGIGVQVHYKPTYQFSFYKNLYGEISLPNAEDFYRAELSLPCHQLMSIEDAKFVVEKLNETLSKHKGCKF